MIFITVYDSILVRRAERVGGERRTMTGASRLFRPERAALHHVHAMFSTRFSTEYVDGSCGRMAI
jgi:hypothetical protein